MKCLNALCMLFTGILIAPKAQAAVTLYTISSEENAYYECMDYAGEIPVEVNAAFEGLMRDGDMIRSGTLCTTWYKNRPGVLQDQTALMLVERGSSILVMSARCVDGEWDACIETDEFVALGDEAQITTQAIYSGDMLSTALPTIVCGDEAYRIQVDHNGCAHIHLYVRKEADGSEVSIMPTRGGFSYGHSAPDGERESWHDHGVSPTRLSAWTMASFPKSIAEIQQYILAHPVILSADEAILHGGNFRMEPTSNSKSMGQYSAKVQVLDTKRGTKWPWYHVRIGELIGWVSGNYVTTSPKQDALHYYGSESGVWSVARAKGDAPLRALPDGETVQMIFEGTLMHVIEENNGWAHVMIPRSEITWQIDWDGTCGFVRSEEIVTGVSIADVRWK